MLYSANASAFILNNLKGVLYSEEIQLMKKDVVNSVIRRLTNDLTEIRKTFLIDFPIEKYIKIIRSVPNIVNYNYIPKNLKEISRSIKSNFNQKIFSLYNKLALSVLIKDSLDILEKIDLPSSIRILYIEWFKRVIEDFAKNPDEMYDYNSDLFLKDLGICNLKMFPAGAQIVEVSGISRNFLFTGGLIQLTKASLFALFKMGSFLSYYQIHTDNRCLDEFNPQGWDDCYIRIADMLNMNPNIKGMFGGSWFYDPALENVSPRLVYLRKTPEQNGAKLFRIGSSISDIKNATAISKIRRKLYKEGKYVPTGYLLIWPRKELIHWANKKDKKFSYDR